MADPAVALTRRARIANLLLPTLTSQIWFVALPPFLTSIAEAVSISPAMVGQIAGLSMLLAAVLALVTGPLIDLYGHRRLMLTGLLALAASSFATAQVVDVTTLVLARLVGSIGRASVIPAAITDAVGGASSGQQRRGVSWAVVGSSVAPLIGLPVLTSLAVQYGWRTAFLLVGCLAMVTAICAWALPGLERGSNRLQPEQRSLLNRYGPLRSDPVSASVLLASLVGNAGVWVCFTYVGVLYEVKLGLGIASIGLALTVVGIGLLIGSILAADRRIGVPSRTLLGACRIGIGLMLGLPFLFPVSAWFIAGLLGIGGLLLGVLNVITPLILRQQSRISTGTIQSLNWFGLTLGIALGSSLGGLLLTLGDLPSVGLGALTLSLLAALILAWPQSSPSITAPSA